MKGLCQVCLVVVVLHDELDDLEGVRVEAFIDPLPLQGVVWELTSTVITVIITIERSWHDCEACKKG